MAALDTDLEAKIEAYLLGRLSEEEQARIEALLFEDDDVFEAIRDAEDDLIDRYLAGELTQADRDAFENVFATTITRQERIALARALLQGALSSAQAQRAAAPAPTASAPAASAPAASAPRASAPAGPAPVQRAKPPATGRLVVATGAALAAALMIVIGWRLIARDRPLTPPVPGDATAQSTVATLSLSQMDLRRGAGNLPRLVVYRGTSAVRFELELDVPIPATGTAVTLRRVEGPIAWQGTLDVEHGQPSVTVPARFVGPGDYVLSLIAPGTAPEDRAEYPFRVIARD